MSRSLRPVEAMDKRERARLSGYLQMHDECRFIYPVSRVDQHNAPILQAAAMAFGVYEMRFWVDRMLIELSRLSGHNEALIAGVIVEWGKMQPRTLEDWRRIWTGE